jgi:hypothetical protein
VAAAFKVVAPVLKALDDSYKLFVRSGVINLCALKLLRVESNRVPFLGVNLELR